MTVASETAKNLRRTGQNVHPKETGYHEQSVSTLGSSDFSRSKI